MNELDKLAPRELNLLHARLEHYIATLHQARTLSQSTHQNPADLAELISEAIAQRDYVAQKLGQQQLESRRRPTAKRSDNRPTSFLFLDECGGHEPDKVDKRFPVFCLAGLVVDSDAYITQVAPRWNGLKAKYLGTVRGRIHEPQMRGKRLKYWLRSYGDREPADFDQSLRNILNEVDYKIIATVIKKDEYKNMFAKSPVDIFLPLSQYHIALDFILERFVHYLHYSANDAKGIVIAERIGPKETAQLIHEYSRLKIEGTQYVSDSWFRYQLEESVMFGDKQDLMPGLEMTDAVARPTAEKVISPDTAPARWESIRRNFYDGGQNRPESFGLKVFPTPIDREFFEKASGYS